MNGTTGSAGQASGTELSVGQCATLACLLEVIAPKPGNVHRGADFEDVGLADFVTSAVAIGPAIQSAACGTPVGRSILAAIQATAGVVRSNTNLGMVLLIAPLAAAAGRGRLARGGSTAPINSPRPSGLSGLSEYLPEVLASLTPQDAADVYAAIAVARPGGLGKVAEMDVAHTPPSDLLDAMRAAAARDMVARQYVTNFADVFSRGVPWLVDAVNSGLPLSRAIVHAQLQWMQEFPDSLIARKCGDAVARQAADRAAEVLHSGSPHDAAYWQAVADLDFWLRSDGHRRNPGTTADLIAASLFAALWEGQLTPPFA